MQVCAVIPYDITLICFSGTALVSHSHTLIRRSSFVTTSSGVTTCLATSVSLDVRGIHVKKERMQEFQHSKALLFTHYMLPNSSQRKFTLQQLKNS